MSDCSTHAMEYPGVTRIKVFFTDKTEREIDYPFVTLDREVECVTVDGIEYVKPDRACELIHVKNGPRYDVWQFSCCGYTFAESVSEYSCNFNYCPNCGAKVVDA